MLSTTKIETKTKTENETALPAGTAAAPSADAPADAAAPGTEQAQHSPAPLLLLDQAVVKNLLTLLHDEVDAIIADLGAFTGAAIATIPDEMERRLAEATAKHKAGLTNFRQQALFAEMTSPLLSAARQRAADLQIQRIHAFQADVIHSQNAALARRATADENLLDDSLQTKYRDAILFNLDSLLSALPPAERHEKLDAASRDFYRAILDRRLSHSPDSAAAMLRSAAVRRALGESESGEYARAALAAAAARKPGRTAQGWVEASLPPARAKEKAAAAGAAGPELLAEYRRRRADRDEKEALAHLLAVQAAWADVAAAGYRLDGAGPAQPALRSLVRDLLDAWLANGGQPPAADYVEFLRYLTTPRRQIWRKLADEPSAHAFIRSLGGVDGWAFALAARWLVAAATPVDGAFLTDLLTAQSGYAKNLDPVDQNRFLAAVHRDRRVKLERLGRTELLVGELSEIGRACAEALKCDVKCKLEFEADTSTSKTTDLISETALACRD